jgi:hypothetical protein
MPYRRNYPSTVQEVLDPALTFKPAALRGVRAFARSKPWRGTPAERRAKFQTLHDELCRVYGLTTKLTMRVWRLRNFPHYLPGEDRIVLPQLSVVTYLHEFAHARGADEWQACRWSINLFRRCFPRSFARCRFVGHTLIRG